MQTYAQGPHCAVRGQRDRVGVMSRDGLVWSSNSGRMCPKCGRATNKCVCRRGASAAAAGSSPTAATAVVRVGRQTKGRRGKGVTVVAGVPGSAADLAKLAKDLKRRCGSGGTLKDGVIEVQGEHRDTLVAELTRRGFTVKRVGG